MNFLFWAIDLLRYGHTIANRIWFVNWIRIRKIFKRYNFHKEWIFFFKFAGTAVQIPSKRYIPVNDIAPNINRMYGIYNARFIYFKHTVISGSVSQLLREDQKYTILSVVVQILLEATRKFQILKERKINWKTVVYIYICRIVVESKENT